MKAIVYSGPQTFSLIDVPKPRVNPDEVLIRVRLCGYCATDLHIHEGHFIVRFPLIPGHEFAGEVVELGSAVHDLALGQRVVADNMEFCGACPKCRAGQPLQCERLVAKGVNAPGGFAEYVAVRAAKVYAIGDLSWREAVMTEPLSCALRGVDRIALPPASEVLLFGAGPTGLLLAQLLKLNGAARLVVAAPPGPKLELARRLAADEVIALDRKDPAMSRSLLREASPDGFDCVIEATGAPALCTEAINHVRTGGQLIVYGVYPEDATVTWTPYEIFKKEIHIKGSFSQYNNFRRALIYLQSKRLQVAEIVSHEYALQQLPDALERIHSRDFVKCALAP